MALSENEISDMTIKLVYGVLESNVRIEYILSQFVDKKPQKSVYVLLKIGVYALTNLTDVPAFAVVSECVEVAKMNGKSGASGFINAVLKNVSKKQFSMPDANDADYLSVVYSKPRWFVDKMIRQYGVEATLEVLRDDKREFEHIRPNDRITNKTEIIKILKENGRWFCESEVGGLCVRADDLIKKMFSQGLITYQSPSSMIAAKALAPTYGCKILDVCSAPGGKAVYLSEMRPESTVVACDLYDHRVDLIHKYKKRMRASNVDVVKNDATLFNPEWENVYDYVLVDAPCSCFGTYKKHPDVFLTRDWKCLSELSEVQKRILENSSRYVKKSGAMVYSTCTLFKEENDDVICWFLDRHSDFHLEKTDISISNDKMINYGGEGMIQILPHGEYDGFFIARMRRADE